MTSGTDPHDEPAPREDAPRPSSLRQLVEAVACLLLAVVLFRTFQVEGYMISTGSMAPSLWGYHKRAVCPACGYPFAVGVAFDDDEEQQGNGTGWISNFRRSGNGVQAAHPPSADMEPCICPNCGQRDIDVAHVPRSQGDQLLVHKNAFRFHPPRRWETIVFRNPNRPTQAYVKRVVGLPGETIRVSGGDVLIDGEIRRKDYRMQQAVRIPVYDHAHAPRDDPGWRSRWRIGEAPIQWKEAAGGFVIDAAAVDPRSSESSVAWVAYRHWIRAGGAHVASVPLEGWSVAEDDPVSSFEPVRYDAEAQTLSCIGAMTEAWRDRLLAAGNDPRYVRAVERLYELSHVAPIMDAYGYNRGSADAPPVPVRDLMFSATVKVTGGKGRFGVRMTDGVQQFDLVLDVGSGEAHLWVDDDGEPVRSAVLPAEFTPGPALVEMSLFDRQVLAAVAGRPLFDPLLLGPIPDDAPPPHRPAQFGARALAVQVTDLKLFRDVYYRSDAPQTVRHAVEEPYRLGPEEYFVLGDNSPVSSDSRCWTDPRVHSRLFLGKPFLVHLPSRPGRVRFGERIVHIRIPDVSRIRYIR